MFPQPVFLPERQGRAGQGWRGEFGGISQAPEESEGEAGALIGRLDASSMPVIFWRQVTREEEGREGGRVCHADQDPEAQRAGS
jgi:hypothetical protein